MIPRTYTLPYTEIAWEAAQRLRRGQLQRYCPTCTRWRWPEECSHGARLTQKQFRRWAKTAPAKTAPAETAAVVRHDNRQNDSFRATITPRQSMPMMPLAPDACDP